MPCIWMLSTKSWEGKVWGLGEHGPCHGNWVCFQVLVMRGNDGHRTNGWRKRNSFSLVWGEGLWGEQNFRCLRQNPGEKIYLRRLWEFGPEEKVPRRDWEYGSDGILVMEVPA